MKLLIANRGEIAIRIARAAADLGIATVAVHSEDDQRALHVVKADTAAALAGVGARAYLDGEQLVAIAKSHGCDAVHPGYGFLSENAAFAERCMAAGLTFVGPSPEQLALFGDKTRARALAHAEGVPIIHGISEAVALEQARAFFAELPSGSAMVIKAIGGGGGRGMRIVGTADEIDEAYRRARSEANAAFGNDAVYVEQFVGNARHVEVQVAADGRGDVASMGTRDCTLQRRHQKLIEVAPAPLLPATLAERIEAAAVSLARAARYMNLGTFEFLVDVAADRFYFIEANARLQVEHTVTEAVTGIDLVQVQLEIARGRTLAELGCTQRDVPRPRGFAIQARVNMETMQADGSTRPAGGLITAFDPPSGPGVRVDTFGYSGYQTTPNFDSLLAKVIVQANDSFAGALRRCDRALADFRIEGVNTNIDFLRALLRDERFAAMRVSTGFIDAHIGELAGATRQPSRFFASAAASPASGQAGAKVDSADPLAVLAYGKSNAPTTRATTAAHVADERFTAIAAPMQGTIVSVDVAAGHTVRAGQVVLVMEAMKMEHEIRATVAGTITELAIVKGDTVFEGHLLALIEPKDIGADADDGERAVDLDVVRPDVAEVIARHAITLDTARPDAVEKRRRTNQRTARENIDALCDADSFAEYGQLVLTPGTGLPIDEVIRKFPTDGMVTGIGSINGQWFPRYESRCVVMAYDYTVLAGTQGALNHPKTDRMLELAAKWRLPVVLFAEGGGGRAGTGGQRRGGRPTTSANQGRDEMAYRPLDTPTFATMGRLSGLVPLVGITSRFCFAGNASLLGCCDVIIATKDSNIGMGGPALIEGGGLGVFRPEEIGPLDVQMKSGVIDVAVEDEVEAVAVAKRYLSYFQGPIPEWDCADQRVLRNVVPENRLRVYDIRQVLHTLADTGSVLELRPRFGLGMVTAFIRIEGRPIGVIANNPGYLSGAVDSDGSDKAARFMQLCDAFDVPILVLCDTPGMMVGPEIERTGLVRHCSRLFVTGANLTVPLVTIVLRKAYGLGAQAMAGGSMKEPLFTVAWPTAEFGGMGLEGQVKLGFRNELELIEDASERKRRYDELVEAAYQRGKALVAGMSFAVDDVIDPADSRRWVVGALDAAPKPAKREGKKRRNVDTW
jgi:acetyl/propionyl-CoA carboxylase alpha subunit/acetyl-CoA carboxylase carboxyltransferase component